MEAARDDLQMKLDQTLEEKATIEKEMAKYRAGSLLTAEGSHSAAG